MIRELVHDEVSLSKKAEPATVLDLGIAKDLLDTLTFNKDKCVGMAANMIGFNKSIIIFDNKGKYEIMLNPKIISKSGKYETEETCLSYLGGPTPCIRYKRIEVSYQDLNLKAKKAKYQDFVAEIIQHEMDHLEGKLI